MCALTGGAAGQLDYVSSGGSNGFNPAATLGQYSDHSEFLDSRAEAKRAHAERMQLLRQVDETRGRGSMDNGNMDNNNAAGGGNAHSNMHSADSKPSAFQIAVSVANASDQKVNMETLLACSWGAYRTVHFLYLK